VNGEGDNEAEKEARGLF